MPIFGEETLKTSVFCSNRDMKNKCPLMRAGSVVGLHMTPCSLLRKTFKFRIKRKCYHLLELERKITPG